MIRPLLHGLLQLSRFTVVHEVRKASSCVDSPLKQLHGKHLITASRADRLPSRVSITG